MTDTPAPLTQAVQSEKPKVLRRMFWNIVLIAHATLAAMWWWRQPSGFAVSDKHFWVNTILPWVVLAAAIIARFPPRGWGMKVRPYILAALAVIWIAAPIAARVLFPVTFNLLFAPLLLAGLLLAGIWLSEHWRLVRRPLDLVVILAAGIGVGLIMGQRGSPPGTQPLNALLPSMPSDTETSRSPRQVALSESASVYVADGAISHQTGPYILAINPMLSFSSRSPDACWVLFALPHERQGPPRILRAIQRDGSQIGLRFNEDDMSILQVTALVGDRSLEAQSFTRFAKTIWSHLNTFNEMSFTGHTKLSIEFSPCPGERIEVLPMDYPAGRPERIAYLAADGLFHIVEARSGEKGPFRNLASGKLARGEPLGITFFDQDKPIYRITFDDFAAQASTNPSPTAGYGLPENAIEFRLEGDTPDAPAAILMSLAATSVGSGYDSVGHGGGTYRNRFKIEPLVAPTGPASRPAE